MNTCFVIQPFDKGRFDKRFNDTFDPAIRDAELEPYRVDRDPGASIPIDEIENGIRNSSVCLAEITLDNPNVWFELGFAIACAKEVVLVCSEERETAFPFDIQHRRIIRYASESRSDFDTLKGAITQRIKAILKKEATLSKVSRLSPLSDVGGLSQHELITLAAVAENTYTPDGAVATHIIHRDVEQNGFAKIAVVIGLRGLLLKELISQDTFRDYDGDEVHGYKVLDQGWEWIMANQDKFVIKNPPPTASSPPVTGDDIPF